MRADDGAGLQVPGVTYACHLQGHKPPGDLEPDTATTTTSTHPQVIPVLLDKGRGGPTLACSASAPLEKEKTLGLFRDSGPFFIKTEEISAQQLRGALV